MKDVVGRSRLSFWCEQFFEVREGHVSSVGLHWVQSIPDDVSAEVAVKFLFDCFMDEVTMDNSWLCLADTMHPADGLHLTGWVEDGFYQ